ncbi:MAG TPA: hypothetical protein VFA09_12705 [Ktedonobacteraceae bacterium]|jgi:hypothetical protein|nr:hypothetical protein [Ktedonobacteraceae bacterium]
MMTLTEIFAHKGKSIETVAAYVQQYLDEHAVMIELSALPGLDATFADRKEQAR